MEKLKGALSHCLTVLVIPCLSIAAYFADPYLLVMYQRFEISMSLFGAWRIAVVLLVALSSIWLASRALQAKRGNAIALALGLAVCAGFAYVFRVFPMIAGLGLLVSVLICSYLCSLSLALVGRYIV